MDQRGGLCITRAFCITMEKNPPLYPQHPLAVSGGAPYVPKQPWLQSLQPIVKPPRGSCLPLKPSGWGEPIHRFPLFFRQFTDNISHREVRVDHSCKPRNFAKFFVSFGSQRSSSTLVGVFTPNMRHFSSFGKNYTTIGGWNGEKQHFEHMHGW